MPLKISSREHFTSLLRGFAENGDCQYLMPRKRGATILTLEYQGKTYTPQRLAYTFAFGEPEPATRIVSHCKTLNGKRKCVNPQHLHKVTLHYDFSLPAKAGRPQGSKSKGQKASSTKHDVETFEKLRRVFKKPNPYY